MLDTTYLRENSLHFFVIVETSGNVSLNKHSNCFNCRYVRKNCEILRTTDARFSFYSCLSGFLRVPILPIHGNRPANL